MLLMARIPLPPMRPEVPRLLGRVAMMISFQIGVKKPALGGLLIKFPDYSGKVNALMFFWVEFHNTQWKVVIPKVVILKIKPCNLFIRHIEQTQRTF